MLPLIAVICLFLISCTPPSTGYLQGNVAIGPLCPAEPCTIDPQLIQESINARNIGIYRGVRSIQKITVDFQGNFQYTLPPGTYTINMPNQATGSSNLPQQITIQPKQTTTVSITIDTGIR